ncbi:MAG: tyrosine-type recombinase/integrase [Planctomycetes bacterium]|nr:tyrosine-type recombinase/integrase [Planctomycetota bacterium]
MLELCCIPQACCRVRANYLGPLVERLADYLLKRGYKRECIKQYLRAAEHFGRWVGTHRIAPAAVDEAVARQFLHRHLPHCHCVVAAPRCRILVRAALRHLLCCMGHQTGHIGGHVVISPAVQSIIQEFDQYMQKTCGLSEQTRVCRRRYARELLQSTFGQRPVRWGRLTPALIMKFVAAYARRCSPATGAIAASAIRSLLRFAQLHGFCETRLGQAVPRIPAWKRGQNSQRLTDAQVRDILGSFDRATAIGRRGYAMALCLADLGLRVSEVVALRLEDLDWRKASVHIARSKNRRARVLPLPRRVGAALAAYLRHDRPASTHRHLFLRLRAPLGEPVGKDLIQGAIRQAYAACGLSRSFAGTHVLRHAAACRMHQLGVPLKQIADLLGHRSLDSTVVYARANLHQLAMAALPWPKGVRL